MPRDVHLVGSVGLDTVDEVFSTVGNLLSNRLKRVPDGEPGGRRMWIGWQYPLFRANSFLAVDHEAAKRTTNGFLPLKIADGVAPEQITFSELGYAREARASWLDFRAARERGDLASHLRFQVCLPTPFAPVRMSCTPSAVPAVERAYERAMMREVEMICAAIPHDELCIQWDVATEMLMWDGRVAWMQRSPDLEEILSARFARQSAVIPEKVELGYHLCYGDLDAKHNIEPLDCRKLVEMANLITASARHKVNYIHMPVPIERDDDAYFAPLKDLRLDNDTKLFLGLVHLRDGIDGARRRINAAAKFRQDFGIASECGISRVKTPAVVAEILRIHAAVAAD